MTTKNHSSNHGNQKHGNREKSSSGIMKTFYAAMLLLMASTSIIGVLGSKRRTLQNIETPTPQSIPVSGGGAADRVLVFHREYSGLSSCEDLTVTSAGSAVYSNCGNSPEVQYTLSNSDWTQIQDWIMQFQPINYDHDDKGQSGILTTHFFLNGQGDQHASDADTQKLIDFADALSMKIASQP